MRMTMAQAVINYINNQYTERDGVEYKFINGVFGIFGHGNVAGMGQALHQTPAMPYYQTRNEQSMVHTAAGYAKMKNRLQTLACTTSIGPGATNMVTAAAGATINRLPVLLLPGDIFARRSAGPLLQQVEMPYSMDLSANDVFKPISRYWDRINRPEQLLAAMPQAMRVLTSQADTGAVTICLPHDVQSEAFDYPANFLEKKVWFVPRPVPDVTLMQRAVAMIQSAKRPMIIAGGGVIYSEATSALATFIEATGIPVAETQAGKGSLHYLNRLALGAVGVTGTKAAAEIAQSADLVIAIGSRLNDFMTASQTAFANPDVKFININIAEFDSHKQGALPLTGDAKATLVQLTNRLAGWGGTAAEYRSKAAGLNAEWDEIVTGYYNAENTPLPSQAEVLGSINSFCDDTDVIVNAAGSAPGDLHRLWRTTDPKQYHLEYGNSCMGYEIPGAIGVKMADPSREVYVVVGDATYLMNPTEIVTAVQEGIKLVIILINNHGYASIGALSRSIGDNGFGTRYALKEDGAHREDDAAYTIDFLPIDLATNAESLGAHTFRCKTVADVRQALQDSKAIDRVCCIYVETDRYAGVHGYTWWDVPIAEVSTNETTQKVRAEYDPAVKSERHFN